MDPALIKLALGGLALLGCIGLLFGIGLALAAHKFAVETNPKVEAVLEVLAGANWGGCGYAGCEAYAEAVVDDPEVPPNLCFPGKSEVAEAVAEITGKQMAAVADMVAEVRCSRIEGNVHKKYSYVGDGSCSGASLAFGGPQACQYACAGFGDCAEACPFNAITMVDYFPVVDPNLCVGCGTRVRTCPKNLIELIPRNARVWVPCSTQDPGKKAKNICEVGCISCKMCVKICPAKAVSLKDNVVQINYQRCIQHGEDCGEICVEKCPRNIFRHFRPDERAAQQLSVVAV